MKTPNDDTIAGDGQALTRAQPPVPRPRAGRRKALRTRSLLSGVLKRPGYARKTVMICKSCELTGGPFAPGEAALLLTVHEQLHHGGVSMHRLPLPPTN